LAKFKLESLHLELQNYAPLIHDILNAIVKGSLKGTTITAAITLKFRNLHMSSFHHVEDHIYCTVVNVGFFHQQLVFVP
jgi:hypothetical protein